ncbi:ERF family protein [Roseateles terrae]|uniref:Single-stranded DNA-binding protein n=1 Tax=Roseateles terrae TaxID=431060 RepID=A0ABR6GRY1_9BURK|nr:ERF family protein [Roseateles terrae]MBB3193979.1 hypothetical protein [Roseateles terrae]OWQ87853.1 hypothetical protein CDN98_06720 [Roseateles terrae]
MNAIAEASPALELQPMPGTQVPALQQAALTVQPRAAVTPADLLQVAMETGDKDIERLERLMQMDIRYRELQEKDRQRDAMLAHKRDFAAFRGENIIVPKSKRVDRGRAGSFNQAEFDAVCGLLSPALSRHGFGFRHDQRFGAKDGVPWVWVTCFLEHKDGHAEQLELEAPPGDLSANTPVQNMQATASYLKRVSLLAITGTATGGEDDESGLRFAGAGDDASPEGDPTLRAGEEAAAKGMVALTAWWSKLDNRQRSDYGQAFTAMRKKARAADEEANHG